MTAWDGCSSRVVRLVVAVWAPDRLSDAEVAEIVDDKLREAGSVLVVESVKRSLPGESL